MTAPVLHIDIPARYRIRVQGSPVGNWFERLDDLTIVRTTRMGQAPVDLVPDQG